MSRTVLTPGGSPQSLTGAETLDRVAAILAAGSYNDFNPAGAANASRIVIQSQGAVTLTGLAGGTDGRVVTLQIVGGGTLTLANASGSSEAANRFNGVGSLGALASGSVVELLYDAFTGAWLLMNTSAAGGGGGGNFTAAGIAALAPMGALDGAEIFPGVQGGILEQVSLNALRAFLGATQILFVARDVDLTTTGDKPLTKVGNWTNAIFMASTLASSVGNTNGSIRIVRKTSGATVDATALFWSGAGGTGTSVAALPAVTTAVVSSAAVAAAISQTLIPSTLFLNVSAGATGGALTADIFVFGAIVD